jgi:TolB-like protein/tetratricopeptide (TPR) repeat protein
MTDTLERLRLAVADRYTVERELGRGGMAIVYLAHDRKLDRDVALKVLRPELAASLGAERFLREIEIAAKLTHPNILPLYDCGATSTAEPSAIGHRPSASGFLYYTMPFVAGESLRDRLSREKQLPIDEALQITKEVADALSHAHALGIVHRDIKPENILFSAGHAVVSDFGIARAVSAAGVGTLTETGLAVGTPAYMSPEQASGAKDVDGRSDIYALGCVLYEMLSGEAPYLGNTPQAIVAKKLSEPAPRVSVVRDRVPPAVEQALTKALSRTPADRFATAARFAEALSAESKEAAPGRRPWLVAAGVLVVLVVAVGLLVLRRGAGGGATRCAGGGTPALAVLPFDVGGDTANEYFADGLTDELAGALGKVPGLRVTGRTSSYAFKGQALDAQTVGRRLGVTHLVEASVRRAGSRARVQAQLVCAADGFVLWSAPYEREMRDVFAVQDSMTAAIVGELRLQLTGTTLAATRAGRTDNPEAHDLYLRGREHLMQGSEVGIRRAMELFGRAIELDSTYADAYAALGNAWFSLSDVYVAPLEALPHAKEEAARALRLDSSSAEASAVFGFASGLLDWDFALIERELRRAEQRAPRSVDVGLLFSCTACVIPRMQAEGLAVAERLESLDPYSPTVPFCHAWCLYLMRRYDETIAQYRRVLALDSTFLYTDVMDAAAWREKGELDSALAAYRRTQRALGGMPLPGLAVTLARAGRIAEARQEFRRLMGRTKEQYVLGLYQAWVYAALGDRDSAFAALDRSLRDHTSGLLGLMTFPELAPLRDDPRWAALVRRVFGDWSPW